MMLFWLLFGHAIADYPLQGDFLARAKNRYLPIPGVPWYQAMLAHTIIHAGVVVMITGQPALGAAEFAAHFVIDDLKCSGKIGFNWDQALHVVCKVVWVLLAWYVL